MLRGITRCAASALGSGTLAIVASPAIAEIGLRGLSGVAHGLMAITALEIIHRNSDRAARRLGWWCLIAVFAKSLIEALTGNAALTLLHFGLMGTPVAICHPGGVLGGVLFFLAINVRLPLPVLVVPSPRRPPSSPRRGSFAGASK